MMKLKIVLAACAAIFAVSAASAQTINEVNAKYNEAVELIQAKDFKQAIPVLNEVVEMGLEADDPSALQIVQQAQKYLPVSYLQYGVQLAQVNDFDEALAQVEKAKELGELYGDRNNVLRATQFLGQIYTAQGGSAFNSEDYTTAIEYFSKGYNADPNNTSLALLLAESYIKSGDLDRGIEIYTDIVNLESRHSRYAEPAAQAKEKIAQYLTVAASEAGQAGNSAEAYAFIDRILQIDPLSPEAHLMRLQLANNAKDYTSVIKWGEESAEAQVDDEHRSAAYFLLGAAYQNTEDKANAIANYRKVTAGNNVAMAREQIALLSK